MGKHMERHMYRGTYGAIYGGTYVHKGMYVRYIHTYILINDKVLTMSDI